MIYKDHEILRQIQHEHIDKGFFYFHEREIDLNGTYISTEEDKKFLNQENTQIVQLEIVVTDHSGETHKYTKLRDAIDAINEVTHHNYLVVSGLTYEFVSETTPMRAWAQANTREFELDNAIYTKHDLFEELQNQGYRNMKPTTTEGVYELS